MSRIIIEGGRPICGELAIQGSKNAVLPILAASVLVSGESVLHGCPDITDVQETLHLMRLLGCRTEQEADTIRVDATEITSDEVTDKAAANSRTSMMLLGALVGRKKRAVVSYPGGCCIGCRPIDLHLSALRRMGVIITETPETIQCEAGALLSTSICFSTVSVGATESVILAAVLSEGTVRVQNAACEPEVCSMCDFLRKCGAKIFGDGSRSITIKGVKKLVPCEYRIPADRIVCGTYLFAAAVTGGKVVLHGVKRQEVQKILEVLEECGCRLQCGEKRIQLLAPRRLQAVPYTKTEAFPGFPTDMQSQLCAILSMANGISMVRETIFEGRFQVIPELRKLGASIETTNDVLLIEGKAKLQGNDVEAKELRGSAALVIAGLAAEGITQIDTDRYLRRGYQDITGDLEQLGAVIRNV